MRDALIDDLLEFIVARHGAGVADAVAGDLALPGRSRPATSSRGDRFLEATRLAGRLTGASGAAIMRQFGGWLHARDRGAWPDAGDLAQARAADLEEILAVLSQRVEQLVGKRTSLHPCGQRSIARACRSLSFVFRDEAASGDIVEGILRSWAESAAPGCRVERVELSDIAATHVRFTLHLPPGKDTRLLDWRRPAIAAASG